MNGPYKEKAMMNKTNFDWLNLIKQLIRTYRVSIVLKPCIPYAIFVTQVCPMVLTLNDFQALRTQCFTLSRYYL